MRKMWINANICKCSIIILKIAWKGSGINAGKKDWKINYVCTDRFVIIIVVFSSSSSLLQRGGTVGNVRCQEGAEHNIAQFQYIVVYPSVGPCLCLCVRVYPGPIQKDKINFPNDVRVKTGKKQKIKMCLHIWPYVHVLWRINKYEIFIETISRNERASNHASIEADNNSVAVGEVLIMRTSHSHVCPLLGSPNCWSFNFSI